MFLVNELGVRLINHFGWPEIADIDVSYADALVTVTVTGEVDVSNTAWLHDTLQDAIDSGAAEVILDVGGLTFMDSTGLAVLQGAHERMQSDSRTFTIQRPAPRMMQLLKVSELLPVLNIRRLRTSP